MIMLLIKNHRTCEIRKTIIDAIHEYNVYCISNGLPDRINYDCLQSYDATWLNLFNWGYKGIVSDDVFEKIKPFLRGDKHE